MNVLVNLLPDTRQAKLKAARRRQLATSIAVVVWIVCGGVVVLMALYTTSQKLIISGLNSKIADNTQKLENTQGLIDALTTQQHLAALPGLYKNRAFFTKFFNAYGEANPQQVSLATMTLGADNSLTVVGTAPSFAAVGKLARAMEAEHVTIGTGAPTTEPYFT
ncbi:MAG TPA: hypothetical protein VLF67_05020, partial [Candidatus Saccharimonas sp.]|nr:hypothetical protein [Candidatus Saccharimonas sp.]